MATTQINYVGDEKPIRYAAMQLRRYLERATGNDFSIRKSNALDPDKKGLWLTVKASGPQERDGIDVDIGSRGGVITGSNPRSVLLGTYRYLTELGFRWVRPGRDGEIIPDLDWPHRKRVRLRETPSYHHRGVCIEGASSWSHVRDMIDWIPKLGFNSYFIQFRSAYHFFERWYNHPLNPTWPREGFSQRKAEQLTRSAWDMCLERGLSIHQIGHGWTCEPFGVPGKGWLNYSGPVPRSIKPYLAKFGGKREFWQGIPINTNLCYGNPTVRHAMAQSVSNYAARHPHIDVIHLWLADHYNNHCECRRCRDTRPADFYLMILNEVDELLSQRGLDTKIVFILYVDLLWPPEKERLRNPDRFILMFAPITRSYSRSYGDAAARMRPFARNKVSLPTDVGENLAYLHAWQKRLPEVQDSFVFEYHLMWDHYKDPGQVDLARVMHQDVRRLRPLGLDGFMSCQVHRLGLPDHLIQTVLGRTLWNRNHSFSAIVDDYYRSAFGRNWFKAKAYLQRLSKLFDPPLLRNERNVTGRRASLKKIKDVPDCIARFQPVIAANRDVDDRCVAKSWQYLDHHATLCLALAPVFEAIACDDKESVDTTMRRLITVARRLERRTHRVLDVHVLLITIGGFAGWDAKRLSR